MPGLAIIRLIVLLIIIGIFFWMFTRELSSRIRGIYLVFAGLTLILLNLLVGSFFHSGLINSSTYENLVGIIGFITGYIGQTGGLILLLFGLYRVIHSLLSDKSNHYTSLVERSMVGVYLIQDGVFRFVNPRLAEIFGYEREELIGESPMKVTAPQSRDQVQKNIEKRISGEVDSIRYQLIGKKKSGEQIMVEAFGNRTTYLGKPAVHGTLIDITHQVAAKEALRESEERYRVLVEQSPEAIFIHDGVRILYSNPAGFELLGTEDPSKVIGQEVIQFVHEENVEAVRERIKAVVEERKSIPTREEKFYRIDGSTVEVEVLGAPVVYQEKDAVQLLVRDISKRKRTAEQLHFLSAMVEQSTDGMIITDLEGKLLFVNRAWAEMHGYKSGEQFRGNNAGIFHSEEDLEKKVKPLIKQTHSQGTATAELEHVRKDDSTLVGRMTTTLLKNDEGEPVAVGVIAQDITESKHSSKLQNALYRISELVHSDQSPQELYEQIHQIIQKFIPAENMYIGLYDESSDTLSFPYYIDEYSAPPSPRKMGKGLTEYVLRHDEPLLLSSGDYNELLEKGEIVRSGHPPEDWLGVPLKTHDKTVGVLTVQNYDKSVPYERQDLEVLKFVSQNIAAVIERKQSEEALRQSEMSYRGLFDNASDAVYIQDRDGKFLDVNKSAEEMYGYPREFFIDKTPEAVSAPDRNDLDKLQELLDRAFRGEPQRFEFWGQDSDGRVFPKEVRLNKGMYFGQSVVVAFARDITSRKESELAQSAMLRISEAVHTSPSLDDLYETIHSIIQEIMPAENFYIALYDEETELLSFPYYLDQYDEPPDPEPLGKGMTEYVLRQGKPLLTSSDDVHQLAEEGEIEIIGTMPVDWLGIPLKTGDRTIGVLVVQSYTEGVRYTEREKEILTFVSDQIALAIARKKTESILASERERMQVTLRSIGDAVITVNTKENVLFMNRTAERLTGWNEEEATGKPLGEIFQVINEKTRDPIDISLHKVMNSYEIQQLPAEAILVARDGTERYIADSIAPLRNEESEIIGAVLVFQDVTEQRNMEEEVLKARKLESVGILAGGIAHDFNNILAGIMGNISLAKMSMNDQEKLEALLSNAEAASQRASKLTKQLLTFSKGGTPVKEETNIAQLIDESVQFALRGSNVRPKLSLDQDLYPVEVDTGQIDQVLQNIVINADQAMPEGGVLVIDAGNMIIDSENTVPGLDAGEYVRITVEDQGEGIPLDHMDQIFDPYFTTKETGTGLGLATSYSIIHKHGGTINVDSIVGEGTTLTIYLPGNPDGEKSNGRKRSGKPATGKLSLDEHVKVLLMDDDPAVRDIGTSILEALGYEVAVVPDGDAAIAKFEQAVEADDPFDIVILDLTIPGGKGGKETIETLRALDPEIIAIVSSGYSTDPILSKHKEYGFDGKAEKPYSVEQLAETLQSVSHVQ